ncbi:S-formylglutathione hydrolase [Herbaspirillum sp. GCM10030257]|uniref:S-formylglutathione hydrolase n=1 Tax=Herbaspirillum sp. GCM10030257 TaxID=3273393 RepID=UPI00361DA2D2
MEIITQQRAFGGTQYFCSHHSTNTGTPMKFSVYVPPATSRRPLPVVYFLAGLTCTDETFMTKAGAQRLASCLGLMLVSPDTSPPKLGLPGEADDWDFGYGAGFYVDAVQPPWSNHYRMFSYVTDELTATVSTLFPNVDRTRQSIMGHSMGGHGALICALKRPEKYRSVSAFAPIASASRCPWGRKALSKYIGENEQEWQQWDAAALLRDSAFTGKVLIDQGTEDKFLLQQLRPELLTEAARATDRHIMLRMQPGYDHSYYFISSFIKEHLEFHALELGS